MTPHKSPVIGIDLGTWKCCVGVVRDGKVEIIENEQGSKTTPSCVAFTKTERLVGEDAKNQLALNPTNTVIGVKRIIGRKFDDPNSKHHILSFPFKTKQQNRPDAIEILVRYKEKKKWLTPEHITAMLLRKMKLTAEAYFSCPVQEAVVSVPACFNSSQRQATLNAAEIAGLTVLQLLHEPTAVALAYKDQAGSVALNQTVMVVDAGGGTIEVSIISFKKSVVKVLAASSDDHLGGLDLDQLLVDDCVKKFQFDKECDIRKNRKAMERLRIACQKAKNSLTLLHDAVINVDCFVEGKDLKIPISREQFSQLFSKQADERINDILKDVLKGANLSLKYIDEVIVVGGCSRIPSVLNKLHEMLPAKKFNVSVNADEAVAHGAALRAALLAGDSTVADTQIFDVIPRDFLLDHKYYWFSNHTGIAFHRNWTFPTSRVWDVSIDSEGRQTLYLYEEEDKKPSNTSPSGPIKTYIFQFERSFNRWQTVPVCFKIDKNGLFSALPRPIGKHGRTNIQMSSSIETSLSKSKEEEKSFQADEQVKQERIRAISKLESSCFEIRTAVKKLKTSYGGQKYPKDVWRKCENLLKACDDTIGLLNRSPNVGIVKLMKWQTQLDERYNLMTDLLKNTQRSDGDVTKNVLRSPRSNCSQRPGENLQENSSQQFGVTLTLADKTCQQSRINLPLFQTGAVKATELVKTDSSFIWEEIQMKTSIPGNQQREEVDRSKAASTSSPTQSSAFNSVSSLLVEPNRKSTIGVDKPKLDAEKTNSLKETKSYANEQVQFPKTEIPKLATYLEGTCQQKSAIGNKPHTAYSAEILQTHMKMAPKMTVDEHIHEKVSPVAFPFQALSEAQSDVFGSGDLSGITLKIITKTVPPQSESRVSKTNASSTCAHDMVSTSSRGLPAAAAAQPSAVIHQVTAGVQPSGDTHQATAGNQPSPAIHHASAAGYSSGANHQATAGDKISRAIYQVEAGEQPSGDTYQATAGEQPSPTVHQVTADEQPSGDVCQAAAGKQHFSAIHQATAGSRPPPAIHQVEAGNQPSSATHQSTAGEQHSPTVHQVAAGEQPSDATHQATVGEQTSLSTHQATAGEQPSTFIHQATAVEHRSCAIHQAAAGEKPFPVIYQAATGKQHYGVTPQATTSEQPSTIIPNVTAAEHLSGATPQVTAGELLTEVIHQETAGEQPSPVKFQASDDEQPPGTTHQASAGELASNAIHQSTAGEQLSNAIYQAAAGEQPSCVFNQVTADEQLTGIRYQATAGERSSGTYHQASVGEQPSGAYNLSTAGEQTSGTYDQATAGEQPSGAYNQAIAGKQASMTNYQTATCEQNFGAVQQRPVSEQDPNAVGNSYNANHSSLSVSKGVLMTTVSEADLLKKGEMENSLMCPSSTANTGGNIGCKEELVCMQNELENCQSHFHKTHEEFLPCHEVIETSDKMQVFGGQDDAFQNFVEDDCGLNRNFYSTNDDECDRSGINRKKAYASKHHAVKNTNYKGRNSEADCSRVADCVPQRRVDYSANNNGRTWWLVRTGRNGTSMDGEEHSEASDISNATWSGELPVDASNGTEGANESVQQASSISDIRTNASDVNARHECRQFPTCTKPPSTASQLESPTEISDELQALCTHMRSLNINLGNNDIDVKQRTSAKVSSATSTTAIRQNSEVLKIDPKDRSVQLITDMKTKIATGKTELRSKENSCKNVEASSNQESNGYEQQSAITSLSHRFMQEPGTDKKKVCANGTRKDEELNALNLINGAKLPDNTNNDEELADSAVCGRGGKNHDASGKFCSRPNEGLPQHAGRATIEDEDDVAEVCESEQNGEQHQPRSVENICRADAGTDTAKQAEIHMTVSSRHRAQSLQQFAQSQQPKTKSQQPDVQSKKQDTQSHQPKTKSQQPDAQSQQQDAQSHGEQPPTFIHQATAGKHPSCSIHQAAAGEKPFPVINQVTTGEQHYGDTPQATTSEQPSTIIPNVTAAEQLTEVIHQETAAEQLSHGKFQASDDEQPPGTTHQASAGELASNAIHQSTAGEQLSNAIYQATAGEQPSGVFNQVTADEQLRGIRYQATAGERSSGTYHQATVDKQPSGAYNLSTAGEQTSGTYDQATAGEQPSGAYNQAIAGKQASVVNPQTVTCEQNFGAVQQRPVSELDPNAVGNSYNANHSSLSVSKGVLMTTVSEAHLLKKGETENSLMCPSSTAKTGGNIGRKKELVCTQKDLEDCQSPFHKTHEEFPPCHEVIETSDKMQVFGGQDDAFQNFVDDDCGLNRNFYSTNDDECDRSGIKRKKAYASKHHAVKNTNYKGRNSEADCSRIADCVPQRRVDYSANNNGRTWWLVRTGRNGTSMDGEEHSEASDISNATSSGELPVDASNGTEIANESVQQASSISDVGTNASDVNPRHKCRQFPTCTEPPSTASQLESPTEISDELQALCTNMRLLNINLGSNDLDDKKKTSAKVASETSTTAIRQNSEVLKIDPMGRSVQLITDLKTKIATGRTEVRSKENPCNNVEANQESNGKEHQSAITSLSHRFMQEPGTDKKKVSANGTRKDEEFNAFNLINGAELPDNPNNNEELADNAVRGRGGRNHDASGKFCSRPNVGLPQQAGRATNEDEDDVAEVCESEQNGEQHQPRSVENICRADAGTDTAKQAEIYMTVTSRHRAQSLQQFAQSQQPKTKSQQPDVQSQKQDTQSHQPKITSQQPDAQSQQQDAQSHGEQPSIFIHQVTAGEHPSCSIHQAAAGENPFPVIYQATTGEQHYGVTPQSTISEQLSTIIPNVTAVEHPSGASPQVTAGEQLTEVIHQETGGEQPSPVKFQASDDEQPPGATHQASAGELASNAIHQLTADKQLSNAIYQATACEQPSSVFNQVTADEQLTGIRYQATAGERSSGTYHQATVDEQPSGAYNLSTAGEQTSGTYDQATAGEQPSGAYNQAIAGEQASMANPQTVTCEQNFGAVQQRPVSEQDPDAVGNSYNANHSSLRVSKGVLMTTVSEADLLRKGETENSLMCLSSTAKTGKNIGRKEELDCLQNELEDCQSPFHKTHEEFPPCHEVIETSDKMQVFGGQDDAFQSFVEDDCGLNRSFYSTNDDECDRSGINRKKAYASKHHAVKNTNYEGRNSEADCSRVADCVPQRRVDYSANNHGRTWWLVRTGRNGTSMDSEEHSEASDISNATSSCELSADASNGTEGENESVQQASSVSDIGTNASDVNARHECRQIATGTEPPSTASQLKSPTEISDELQALCTNMRLLNINLGNNDIDDKKISSAKVSSATSTTAIRQNSEVLKINPMDHSVQLITDMKTKIATGKTEVRSKENSCNNVEASSNQESTGNEHQSAITSLSHRFMQEPGTDKKKVCANGTRKDEELNALNLINGAKLPDNTNNNEGLADSAVRGRGGKNHDASGKFCSRPNEGLPQPAGWVANEDEDDVAEVCESEQNGEQHQPRSVENPCRTDAGTDTAKQAEIYMTVSSRHRAQSLQQFAPSQQPKTKSQQPDVQSKKQDTQSRGEQLSTFIHQATAGEHPSCCIHQAAADEKPFPVIYQATAGKQHYGVTPQATTSEQLSTIIPNVTAAQHPSGATPQATAGEQLTEVFHQEKAGEQPSPVKFQASDDEQPPGTTHQASAGELASNAIHQSTAGEQLSNAIYQAAAGEEPSGVFNQVTADEQLTGIRYQATAGERSSGTYHQATVGEQPSGAYNLSTAGEQTSGTYNQATAGEQPSGAYNQAIASKQASMANHQTVTCEQNFGAVQQRPVSEQDPNAVGNSFNANHSSLRGSKDVLMTTVSEADLLKEGETENSLMCLSSTAKTGGNIGCKGELVCMQNELEDCQSPFHKTHEKFPQCHEVIETSDTMQVFGGQDDAFQIFVADDCGWDRNFHSTNDDECDMSGIIRKKAYDSKHHAVTNTKYTGRNSEADCSRVADCVTQRRVDYSANNHGRTWWLVRTGRNGTSMDGKEHSEGSDISNAKWSSELPVDASNGTEGANESVQQASSISDVGTNASDVNARHECRQFATGTEPPSTASQLKSPKEILDTLQDIFRILHPIKIKQGNADVGGEQRTLAKVSSETNTIAIRQNSEIREIDNMDRSVQVIKYMMTEIAKGKPEERSKDDEISCKSFEASVNSENIGNEHSSAFNSFSHGTDKKKLLANRTSKDDPPNAYNLIHEANHPDNTNNNEGPAGCAVRGKGAIIHDAGGNFCSRLDDGLPQNAGRATNENDLAEVCESEQNRKQHQPRSVENTCRADAGTDTAKQAEIYKTISAGHRAQSQQPDAQSQQQDARSQQPKTTVQHPDAQSQQQDAQSQQLKTTSQQAEAQSKQQDAQSQQSKTTSQHLDAQSKQQDAQSQQPKTTSQQAEAQSKQQDTQSQQSTTTSQHPDALSQQQDARPQQSKTTSQQPDVQSQQRDVQSQQPNITFLQHDGQSQQQDVQSQQQKTTSQQPDAQSQQQDTQTQQDDAQFKQQEAQTQQQNTQFQQQETQCQQREAQTQQQNTQFQQQEAQCQQQEAQTQQQNTQFQQQEAQCQQQEAQSQQEETQIKKQCNNQSGVNIFTSSRDMSLKGPGKLEPNPTERNVSEDASHNIMPPEADKQESQLVVNGRRSSNESRTVPSQPYDEPFQHQEQQQQVSRPHVASSIYQLKSPAIGIDLGTWKCCVGVIREGKVEIIENERGSKTTPSYVAFTETARLVGEDAKDQVALNPTNTVFGVKRIIGRRFDDQSLQTDMPLYPFTVTPDEHGRPRIPVQYRREDKVLCPELVSAMMLEKMKLVAEYHLGCKVRDAVISVPAYFNNSQRQATKDAGAIAGLNVLGLINEPTAAALAYRDNKARVEPHNVLIFDLGGGTFDVAVIKVDESGVEVKGVCGDAEFGGNEMDVLLMKHFEEKFTKIHAKSVFRNKKGLVRLRTASEKAIKTLTLLQKTKVEVDSLIGDIDFNILTKRQDFEQLYYTDAKERIEAVLTSVLQQAKIQRSEIDKVVLVGGTSRIPKIQSILKEFFGIKALNKTVNPDEAVAHGAALHAAFLAGDSKVKKMNVVELVQNPVKDYFGVHDATFKKFREIRSDKQLALLHCVKKIQLIQEPVNYYFVLDPFGVFQVYSQSTESLKDINWIPLAECLTETQITELKALIRRFVRDDQELKEGVAAMNDLEEFCFQTKALVSSNSSLTHKLGQNELRAIADQCEEMICWLDDNVSATKSDYQLKKRNLCSQIVAAMKKGDVKMEDFRETEQKLFREVLKG